MTPAEMVTYFNWVDIFILLIFLICIFKGTRNPLVVEIFNVLGMLICVYMSYHYFSALSDSLSKRVRFLDVATLDFLSFISIAILSYVTVVLLRKTVCHLFKIEAVSMLDRWGGLPLGFVRGLFVASIVLFVFYLPFINYFQQSARKSYLGSRLVWANVRVYEFLYNGIVTKFYAKEDFNKNVYEVVKFSEVKK